MIFRKALLRLQKESVICFKAAFFLCAIVSLAGCNQDVEKEIKTPIQEYCETLHISNVSTNRINNYCQISDSVTLFSCKGINFLNKTENRTIITKRDRKGNFLIAWNLFTDSINIYKYEGFIYGINENGNLLYQKDKGQPIIITHYSNKYIEDSNYKLLISPLQGIAGFNATTIALIDTNKVLQIIEFSQIHKATICRKKLATDYCDYVGKLNSVDLYLRNEFDLDSNSGRPGANPTRQYYGVLRKGKNCENQFNLSIPWSVYKARFLWDKRLCLVLNNGGASEIWVADFSQGLRLIQKISKKYEHRSMVVASTKDKYLVLENTIQGFVVSRFPSTQF